MSFIRAIRFGVCGLAAMSIIAGPVAAQVVINELVKEERTAGSGGVTPDRREFVELYNAGATAVDISNWSIVRWDYMADGPGLPNITVPAGSTIQPNDFFVIGGVPAQVPNVDYTPDAGTDLFPDVAAYALELRDASSVLVDAVAYDVWQAGIFPPTAEQQAQIGQGFHGQLLSMNHNVAGPNSRVSWSRYRDGRDTNNNGRDFGIQPLTPGASNDLPLNESHTVPDVDALATGTQLSQYHASFVLPRAIEPGVVSGANPRAIPASPQGGKAIVAWDETGGGNTAYSKELVNSYDVYAYLDTTPLGVAVSTNDEEWETSMYGIGSADAFFGNPDPTGGIFVSGTITQNASTGIAWMYQQYENPVLPEFDFSRLVLLDMGDGGNSLAEAGEWNVIQTIDMSTVPSGWYRLGLDYDPTTGDVTATFDDQKFMFNTATGLLGSFFVGYREGITDEQSRLELLNPPIYDLFETAPPVLAGDYNDDGKVDAADYVVWRNGGPLLNETVTPGSVTPEDYDEWQAHFGNMTPGGGQNSAAAVPEPGSVALAMLALCGCAAIRRRT